jgi:hypothetical protein
MKQPKTLEQVSLISLEARLTARLPDGRAVFLKTGPDGAAKEKTCLNALRGLAVPRRLRAPAGWSWAGLSARDLLLAERVPGGPLDRAGLSGAQLLGAWAFVAEQLVAFRRRQVLYTDVKCGNVLAVRRPFRVVVVDFDFAMAVERADRYPTESVGLTPGFEAPEQAGSRRVTERAVVYQLGMLLLHCWTGAENATARDAGRGLPRLRRDLLRLKAPAVARLVAASLERQPERRPRGYEAVLTALKVPGCMPESARDAWSRLRAPYARALAALRLES